MKKAIETCALIAAIIAYPVSAEAAMDTKMLSKYMGVISCVDRTFFDGGYTPGEPQREALMNAMLAKVGLPNYQESLMGSPTKDKEGYLAGYSACDDNWDYLAAEARKVGIDPDEEWD